MAVHQPSSGGRLSREELRAEFTHAREQITDLEADRWQSHERLIDSLAEHLQDGFSLLSPEGVHLDVNSALCAMVGYTHEELIGVGLPHPHWPPEERERIADDMRRSLGEAPGSVELTFMRKSGERFPVLLAPSALRDEAGEPVCIFATIKDISELKRAQTELAASNAHLARALDGTVRALGATVDLRDPYTAGHERRVAMLSEAIAARLGWEGERLAALRMAALVHDVGKIAVPSEILSKPCRLSETEFALIRQHPRVGRDLLTSVDFELPVAEIVHQHHERLDGSGYPAGLRGDEILPEARVVAVADVVEAMISHRPYRPALPLEEALAEIADGARYDAVAAAVCRRLFEEEGFTLPE
jgi:PAS domain S-box-containing protein/putative nucleotidyltransferase with HDIG domain